MESGREKIRKRQGWSIRRVEKNAKKVIFSANEKKQKECTNDLNDSECQNEIFRMAKQMVKERQDITGLNCINGASGIVDGKVIQDSLKEYMEKLMHEENEWDRKISAEVMEGPADCIRMSEVRAVLKKMKYGKWKKENTEEARMEYKKSRQKAK